ncbi:hypothetical protein FQA39_LY00056 [Lamprigera yunnana]|nr:hypothetical protein FQA39_LY00056 [Lamprigera yunnana]
MLYGCGQHMTEYKWVHKITLYNVILNGNDTCLIRSVHDNVRKEKSNFDESSQQQESLQEHESSQQQELDQEAATSSDTSEIIPLTPKVTKRRKVEIEDSDPVMDKAIAILHNLDKTIQSSTICASSKTDSNIFAEYVAQKLQVIDDF